MTLATHKQQDMSGSKPLHEDTALIYGEVVTVKPIPTRQVTQIVIEIPEEHHIAATQLLFKRNAFIMPCADKSPLPGIKFGVTTLGSAMNPPQAPAAPTAPAPRPQVNVTQWLAIKGADPNFQTFLGVSNEVAAAEAVRTRCNVQSRAEIPHNENALKIFMTEIYAPFNTKFPTIRRFVPSSTLKGNKS